VTVGLLPCAYGGKRMDLLKKGSGLTFCDGNKSVHFDRESLIKMAHRYCDELMRILNKN
jgi:hypothetical protein